MIIGTITRAARYYSANYVVSSVVGFPLLPSGVLIDVSSPRSQPPKLCRRGSCQLLILPKYSRCCRRVIPMVISYGYRAYSQQQ